MLSLPLDTQKWNFSLNDKIRGKNIKRFGSNKIMQVLIK